MGYSPPGSSVHGLSQAMPRQLERGVISFSSHSHNLFRGQHPYTCQKCKFSVLTADLWVGGGPGNLISTSPWGTGMLLKVGEPPVERIQAQAWEVEAGFEFFC